MTTEQIWTDFKDELLGFIKSRINDIETSEDLLQDVFIKIHKNLNSLNESTNLASWIYRVTRNTIIDYYRKKKVLVYKDTIEERFPEELPKSDKDFTKCLNVFMKQLPDKDQDVLSKVTYGEVSQKEYAEQMNQSYSAVKSRVQRAREKLKEQFVTCCEVESDKYGNVISDNCKC